MLLILEPVFELLQAQATTSTCTIGEKVPAPALLGVPPFVKEVDNWRYYGLCHLPVPPFALPVYHANTGGHG